MTVDVVAGSAVISLDWSGYKPNIFANRNAVVFHSGKGFKPFLGQVPDMPSPGLAWTAKGRVQLRVSPGENMRNWQFGFLQMMRTTQWETFYVGRTRKEGSTSQTPFLILPGGPFVDTLEEFNPYAGKPIFLDDGVHKPPTIECEVGDHPFSAFPLVETNLRTRGSENLLFHTKLGREFWTILSLRQPNGEYIHLKHFKWKASYELKINAWQGSAVGAAGDFPNNVFKVLDFSSTTPTIEPGAPPELLASGLKFDGAESSANDIHKRALSAIANRTPGAVTENDNWFNNVPSNFFTPAP